MMQRSTTARLTASPSSDSAPRSRDEQQHQQREDHEQHHQRRPALEVDERVRRLVGLLVAGDLLGLRDAQLVADVDRQVDAVGVPLDHASAAGLLAAVELDQHPHAAVADGRPARSVVDPGDGRLVARLHDLGELLADIGRPQQHHRGDGAERDDDDEGARGAEERETGDAEHSSSAG